MSVDPLYLSAALGLGLESALSDIATATPVVPSPWDAWWVAIRSGGKVHARIENRQVCSTCSPSALAEAGCAVPRHPGLTWRCDCFERWASQMRSPSPLLRRTWALPQRLTVALLKPGAPRPELRAALHRRFSVVHQTQRTLTPADCSRLYADAYGADFVAATTAYLTSGPCEVLVLVGDEDAVLTGLRTKRAVRADLAADRMRNHLHMPDTPAEALADIALLTGPDILQTLYDRWEAPHDRHRRTRLAAYRARLDAGRRRHGVALTDR